MTAPATTTRIPYTVKADWIEACNCNHGCNCQFAGFPNDGNCEFILGWRVRNGTFGAVTLDGLTVAVIAKYPKAIHEGNGHVVVFIDDKASQAEADAMLAILSGQMGGMPWEALAGTIGTFEGPIRKPVEIVVAGERSRVRVPGSIDLALTPLKDPLTGEEKSVHIVYPKGGFLWNDGAVATTDVMRVSHGDLRFEWPNRFASAAEANWSNQ